MSLIREFSEPPYAGLPADELIAAIQHLQGQPEFAHEQIVGVSARNDGRVMVKTGEMRGHLAGGGRIIVLVKTSGAWTIRENGVWAS